MGNEIEYEELINRVIPKKAYDYFINDLQETYKNEFGWVIGNINKKDIDQNNIEVSLTLEKYKILESSTKTR